MQTKAGLAAMFSSSGCWVNWRYAHGLDPNDSSKFIASPLDTHHSADVVKWVKELENVRQKAAADPAVCQARQVKAGDRTFYVFATKDYIYCLDDAELPREAQRLYAHMTQSDGSLRLGERGWVPGRTGRHGIPGISGMVYENGDYVTVSDDLTTRQITSPGDAISNTAGRQFAQSKGSWASWDTLKEHCKAVPAQYDEATKKFKPVE